MTEISTAFSEEDVVQILTDAARKRGMLTDRNIRMPRTATSVKNMDGKVYLTFHIRNTETKKKR
jgi:hypothetical protein